jgi:3-isopropylmalate/(R)-2-methylmalate dehydratase large subunit
VVLNPDHFTPNKDINSAAQCKIMRDFAREQEITHYYESGKWVWNTPSFRKRHRPAGRPGDRGGQPTCTYGSGGLRDRRGQYGPAAAMLTGEVWFKVPESIRLSSPERSIRGFGQGSDPLHHR